mmetsp:Transcript_114357/g.356101  ORF Transcript_114357/g.356101 Transcript_114357/m.356101 type:complete len:217 (+) Transcript_114357:269-919(+)
MTHNQSGMFSSQTQSLRQSIWSYLSGKSFIIVMSGRRYTRASNVMPCRLSYDSTRERPLCRLDHRPRTTPMYGGFLCTVGKQARRVLSCSSSEGSASETSLPLAMTTSSGSSSANEIPPAPPPFLTIQLSPEPSEARPSHVPTHSGMSPAPMLRSGSDRSRLETVQEPGEDFDHAYFTSFASPQTPAPSARSGFCGPVPRPPARGPLQWPSHVAFK